MPYTPSRSDWKNLPDRSTPVTAEFIEEWQAGIADAVAKAEEALANPGGGASITGGGTTADTWATATAYTAGRIIAVDGKTYAAKNAHTSGATFAGDLSAHWALVGVDPASAAQVTTDEDAGTVGIKTDNGTIVLTGTYVPDGGGGGDGPWADKLVGRWTAPHSDLTLEPAVGAENLVGEADGGGAYRQENHAGLTVGGVTGAMWRGTTRSYVATLGTAVPLEATLGYTTFTVVLRNVSFDGSATSCNIGQIGSDTAGLLLIAVRDGANDLKIRVAGHVNHFSAVLASPEKGTFIVPGDGSSTSMTSFLTSGWHVLTLALKQGSLGKVVLDGTTVVTGIDSDGFGPTTIAELNTLTGGDFAAGYPFKDFAVGTALTDSDITTMHADLAG